YRGWRVALTSPGGRTMSRPARWGGVAPRIYFTREVKRDTARRRGAASLLLPARHGAAPRPEARRSDLPGTPRRLRRAARRPLRGGRAAGVATARGGRDPRLQRVGDHGAGGPHAPGRAP